MSQGSPMSDKVLNCRDPNCHIIGAHVLTDECNVDDGEGWGCEHCRNDGILNHGRCPKCDAEFSDEIAESNRKVKM